MFQIGFTGTKKGMTFAQKISFEGLAFWSVYNDMIESVAHGDCIGADQQFHDFSFRKGYKVIIHPPLNPKFRAYCTIGNVEIRAPRDYLARNYDIVEESDILIATPRLMGEERRSGTWATIRYARDLLRPIYIIWPNGRIEMENEYVY